MLSFLLDGVNWSLSTDGNIPQRLLEHLAYTGVALLIAFLIAFPVGLLIGHTNRFAFLAINAGNAGRSLPTLGLLSIVVVAFGGDVVPAVIALVVLAIPSIMTNTYAGIRAVDPAVVDAARGMGMTEPSVLLRAELPPALPVIFGGLRNATLQVVSTATIAAVVGLGGLGRYLIDGLATRDYAQMVAGAVLVGVLAVTLDLMIAGLSRILVSPGVSGRTESRRTRRRARAVATSDLRPTTPESALTGAPSER
ncbi:MAG: ABC transporter permease [Nocardioidaceae bacterium]